MQIFDFTLLLVCCLLSYKENRYFQKGIRLHPGFRGKKKAPFKGLVFVAKVWCKSVVKFRTSVEPMPFANGNNRYYGGCGIFCRGGTAREPPPFQIMRID